MPPEASHTGFSNALGAALFDLQDKVIK